MRSRSDRRLFWVMIGLVVVAFVAALAINSLQADDESSTGGYPDADAEPCNQNGSTGWCKNGEQVSDRGYDYRYSPDYAAWRLVESGVQPENVTLLGHANQWDDHALGAGIRVTADPVVGAVAQTDDGPFGHVAYIAEVSGDVVTVEEYNHEDDGIFSRRTGIMASLGFDRVIRFDELTS